MKKSVFLFGLLMLGLVASGSVFAQNKLYTQETWKLFCKQLALNLENPNPGVRISTLQHISFYSQFPEFELCDKAVEEVAALYNTGNARGMEFIEKQMAKEKDPRIKHLCCAAVQNYRKAQKAINETELIADSR